MANALSDFKVDVSDVKSYMKKLEIEIPLETVSAEMEKGYKEIGKGAKIQGFRKGHVPRALLEKMYAKALLGDVAKTLINEAVEAAVMRENLQVVGQPTVEDATVEPGLPISFTTMVEVIPEIDLPDYSGWKFEREVVKVDDAMLDGFCKEIQERRATLEPVEDRASQEGDYVLVDHAGTVDGNEVEELGGKNRQALISADGKNVLVDFQKNLAGMKVDEEKEFSVTLPKHYPNPALAEKEVTFKVKMNGIKELKMPELTDALVEEETTFKTVQEFRDHMKTTAEKNAADQADRGLRKKIMEEFNKHLDFELPPNMTTKYIDRSRNRIVEQNRQRHGIDITTLADFDRDGFDTLCKKEGEEGAREEVVIANIARREDLKADEDEVRKQMAEMAGMMQQSGQQPDQSFWQAAYSVTHQGVLFDGAYRLIMSKMDITDKLIDQNQDKDQEEKP